MTIIDNTKPIYQQIFDLIGDRIMDGTYTPDAAVPSVREFAAAMQVNANTVMRAYQLLSDKGIIANRRGIGYFVTAEAHDKIRAIRNETFFNAEAKAFFTRVHSMGITPEQLANLYQQHITSPDK